MKNIVRQNMKRYILKSPLLVAMAYSILLLFGCGGGSSNSAQTLSPVLTIKEADALPDVLNDTASLQNDLSRLFGNADDEPVDINDDETIQEVFENVGY